MDLLVVENLLCHEFSHALHALNEAVPVVFSDRRDKGAESNLCLFVHSNDLALSRTQSTKAKGRQQSCQNQH